MDEKIELDLLGQEPLEHLIYTNNVLLNGTYCRFSPSLSGLDSLISARPFGYADPHALTATSDHGHSTCQVGRGVRCERWRCGG